MILFETVERAIELLEKGSDHRSQEEIRRSLKDSIEELSRAASELRRQGFDETSKLVEETINMIRRAMQGSSDWDDKKETLKRAFDRALMAKETMRNEADGSAPTPYKRLLQDVRRDISSLLTSKPSPSYGQSTPQFWGSLT